MTILRALGTIALLPAIMILAACTAAPISPQQTLNGNEGAVVIKLIANSGGEFDPAESLSLLRLERLLPTGEKLTGRDVPTLIRTRQGTNSTAVFSGMVPPGRYIVKDAQGSQGNTTYTFPIDSRFGTFEVVRGEVSLLGTLLVQPQLGTRFVMGYIPPNDEFQRTFETLYPALAAQAGKSRTHGFDATADLQRRAVMAKELKGSASLWNGLAQHANGEFTAGSRLGKVLWRKAGTARWKELDVGTWSEVMAVRPYRDGLLAAGEEGLLRHSVDEGRSWKALTPPDEALIQLAEPLSDGTVVAFARRDRLWSAYASNDLEAGHWRKIGEFPDTASINVAWKRPSAVSMTNGAGLMLPNGDLYVTDGKSVTRAGSGQTTLDIASLPDGTLISQVAPLTRTTLLSKDNGMTWTDLNTSRFVVAIAFKDAQTAYAVAPIAPGVFAGEIGLMTTRDGGKTWSHTGQPPGLTGARSVRQMMVDRSDGSLLAFLPDNVIVRSADEGKSWKFAKDN